VKIIFYDGSCGLCQRSIRFLVKIDKEKKLLFAPLNGETYKKMFGSKLADFSTVVFYNNGHALTKSLAFIDIFKLLGENIIFYRLIAKFIQVIPTFISNYIYDQIVMRRKAVLCIILNKDERFLK
jgi:predicted DCC family thiol-disulfide oxidoreductase YuxK